jgi:hypothetical protein
MLLALAEKLPATPPMQVISIDFQPNAPFGPNAPVDFTGVESQAATANPVFGNSNIWNYLAIAPATTQTVNPSFSSLVNSAGVGTTVGLSFTGSLTAADDAPIDNSGSDGLENDYLLVNAAGASSSATYTITGLPANTSVTLYLYAPNFGASHSQVRGDSFTVNGTPVTIAATGSTDDTALLTVTTDPSGDISGTWAANGSHEGDWSGMQLAYVVPEPGAALLALLGLSSLFGVVRLRRLA